MSAIFRLLVMVLTLLAAERAVAGEKQNAGPVDTALIVSVDVSGSVDDGRYALQMDGIARALEDNAVIAAILGGRRGSIFFTLVEWSERPAISIAWTRIASKEDAQALAAQVRRTPRQEGEFTCVAHMMKFVSDLVVTTKPAPAGRVVMDVSGDGIDNCDGEEATIANRDALVATGMTINGLPINEGDPSRPLGGGAFRAPGRPFQQRKVTAEIKTLEPWYEKHVIGGDGAFLLPANGYKDFRNAIRRKFVIEVSGRQSPGNSRHDAERVRCSLGFVASGLRQPHFCRSMPPPTPQKIHPEPSEAKQSRSRPVASAGLLRSARNGDPY